MNRLNEKLEQAIGETLERGEYMSAAELTKAYAALRSVETKERTATSIEKTLTVFAGIGEAMGELTKQMNSAELTKMMQQQK